MRAVVQRVSRARVTVDGETTGAIDAGLLVYLGIGPGDGEREVAWVTSKVADLRVFPDEAGRFDRSVTDIAGSVLVVSQFTPRQRSRQMAAEAVRCSTAGRQRPARKCATPVP